jgi:hypothetical protein
MPELLGAMVEICREYDHRYADVVGDVFKQSPELEIGFR